MKLHAAVIPAAVVLCAGLTFPLKEAFNVPSMTWESSATTGAPLPASARTVEMIVDGVHCRGTANFLAGRLKQLRGILDIAAYATDHRVVVTYDANVIGPDAIREATNAPVQGRDGVMRPFFTVQSMESR